MKATQIPERVKIRAATRYVLDPERGCHISTYSVGSHGYAQIGWSVPGQKTSAMMLVHRVIWMSHYGDIEPGMTVDHMCKQRKCINIKHLRLLTNFENGRRTHGRDWPLGQCVNGHPNSNLQTWASGKRSCMLCDRQRHAAYRAKKRADKLTTALDRRAS